ncbi:unnamed protein product [Durusdinium trenchii]|uniref:Anaphase-promoting complex subunit 5 n=1 Tax=Durusdinium trenchii TaxID=1381693 RepID=A0ABP0RYS0_9DINO
MRFRTLQHTLQSSQFSTLSEAAVCHVLVLAPSQAWIDLVQTRRRQIPTSALVECCDELSRARCHDFDLWKSLGEELTCRLTSGRRAQALAMAAPTALESVSVLTSFAGVFCRHRRLLDALESRRDAEGLRSLHTMELKRLLVACGQLKAAVSLGEIAIDFLSHREIGSSLVLLQTVHAAVRLCLFPARQNRLDKKVLDLSLDTMHASCATQRWHGTRPGHCLCCSSGFAAMGLCQATCPGVQLDSMGVLPRPCSWPREPGCASRFAQSFGKLVAGWHRTACRGLCSLLHREVSLAKTCRHPDRTVCEAR